MYVEECAECRRLRRECWRETNVRYIRNIIIITIILCNVSALVCSRMCSYALLPSLEVCVRTRRRRRRRLRDTRALGTRYFMNIKYYNTFCVHVKCTMFHYDVLLCYTFVYRIECFVNESATSGKLGNEVPVRERGKK